MADKPAVIHILQSLYGGNYYLVEDNLTINDLPVKLCDNDMERVAAVFVNTGANPIYIGTNPAMTYGEGIYLIASGGAMTMNIRQDFVMPAYAWYGICASGLTSTLHKILVKRYTA